MAPAETHRLASSRVLPTIIIEGEEVFLKTLAFLSFQSSQETNIRSEAIPFRDGERARESLVHQSLTLFIVAQSCVERSTSPILALIVFQTVIEKRHWNRRWAADSWTWLRSGHKPQFGHPLRCSLSAVQTYYEFFCSIEDDYNRICV